LKRTAAEPSNQLPSLIAQWRLPGTESDAPGVDVRIAQATAFRELAEYTAGLPKDRDALLDQLTAAFGSAALDVLNTPPVVKLISPTHAVCSPAEQRKKAECAAESLVTSVRNALRGLINWKFPLPDKRSTQPDGVSLVWIAQLTAKDIFRATLERPTKQLIREIMERDGYGFSGHDAPDRWEQLFTRAALQNLP
jgi:hypothetical protein